MTGDVQGYFPERLILEVKNRPGLWKIGENAGDRDYKLMLWKEVGAAMFSDWERLSKANAYDRVLQLQKKWRSLRDAYARELRVRRSGVRINKRVYRYFKRMSFLGGYDGKVSDDDDDDEIHNDTVTEATQEQDQDDDPLVSISKKKAKKRVKRQTVQVDELPLVPQMSTDVGANETDSDRLFLLSFVPEMRQLPTKIKMWARAQIANVMQEAVTCVDNDAHPGEVKLQRRSSSDMGTE